MVAIFKQIKNNFTWNWSVPRYLSATECYIQDPIGDGNGFISALVICTFHSNTNLDCFMLRSQINDFYYSILTYIYLALF